MADQDKTTKGRNKQVGGSAGQGSAANTAPEHSGDISLAGTEPIGRASSSPGPMSGGAGLAGASGSVGTPGGTGRLAGGTSSMSGGSGAATATARSLYDQAKETAGQAYDAVTEKAATTLEEQKTTVSSGLSAVADSLRQAAGSLSGPHTDNQLATFAGQYTSTASQKLNDVARYFEQTDVRGMAHDIENYARRNPAIFIGAAFGLGLLAARFLKSTPPHRSGAAHGQTFSAAAAGSTSGPAPSAADRGSDLTSGANPGRTMPNPM